MTKDLRLLRFDEFAENSARFFSMVSRDHEPIVVENDEGEGVILRHLDTSTTEMHFADEDYNAFRASYGGWADVDSEEVKAKMRDSRKSSRPLIDL